MKRYLFLIIVTLGLLFTSCCDGGCGKSQSANYDFNKVSSNIQLLSTKQLKINSQGGYVRVHLVEVNGKRFVIATNSQGLGITPYE